MLTRRVCASGVRSWKSAQCTPGTLVRPFTASTATKKSSRAPALGDITLDSAASFHKKQKEFRNGLIVAQQRKEQEESGYHFLQRPGSNPIF